MSGTSPTSSHHSSSTVNSWIHPKQTAKAIAAMFKIILTDSKRSHISWTKKPLSQTSLASLSLFKNRTKCRQQYVRKSGRVVLQIIHASPFLWPWTSMFIQQLSSSFTNHWEKAHKVTQMRKCTKYLYYLVIILTFIVTYMVYKITWWWHHNLSYWRMMTYERKNVLKMLDKWHLCCITKHMH